jgi:hypothetical protein
MGRVTAPADRDGEPAVPADATGPRSSRPAGKLDDTRCSVRALARGDSPVATAAPAQRWVLIEQAGPWGRDALSQSRIDEDAARRLAHRSRSEGVRLLLIRRPDARAADAGRRWAYVDSRPGREGAWWSERQADVEVAETPWDGSVGERQEELTYLVCSHSGHDACCALRGRPLARGLMAAGADVWECSHLGGDRFAPNVVVLPLGLYYGQVPDDGADLLTAHARGEVALPWLRGRAGLSPAAQAAQDEARRELGRFGVDDLPLRTQTRLTPVGADIELWAVTLIDGDCDVVVAVQSRPSTQAVRLTCSATHDAHVRVWEVLSISLSGCRQAHTGQPHPHG